MFLNPLDSLNTACSVIPPPLLAQIDDLRQFAELAPLVLTTALAGCGIGLVSGLFGVGGGFLIVPVISALYGFRLAWIGIASCQALGQAIYEATQAEQASAGGQEGAAGGAGGSADDVVDAEVVEDDQERK